MTPLRQRMLNAMVLRGFAALTHVRYTLLGQTLLGQLRAHWRGPRPTTWLFCNHTGIQPVSIESAERA